MWRFCARPDAPWRASLNFALSSGAVAGGHALCLALVRREKLGNDNRVHSAPSRSRSIAFIRRAGHHDQAGGCAVLAVAGSDRGLVMRLYGRCGEGARRALRVLQHASAGVSACGLAGALTLACAAGPPSLFASPASGSPALKAGRAVTSFTTRSAASRRRIPPVSPAPGDRAFDLVRDLLDVFGGEGGKAGMLRAGIVRAGSGFGRSPFGSEDDGRPGLQSRRAGPGADRSLALIGIHQRGDAVDRFVVELRMQGQYAGHEGNGELAGVGRAEEAAHILRGGQKNLSASPSEASMASERRNAASSTRVPGPAQAGDVELAAPPSSSLR